MNQTKQYVARASAKF